MNKPIALRCYYHTDDTSQAEECGMDYDITDCIIKTVMFYQIVAISPREETVDGKKVILANIHCAGTCFNSVDTYVDVLKQINDRYGL